MVYIVVSILKRGTFVSTFHTLVSAKTEYVRETNRHDVQEVYIAKVMEGYRSKVKK